MLCLAAGALADPSLVLIHLDNYAGYGDAVLDACDNLWPGATILPVLADDWATFNTALTTGPYDLIILENWNVNTDGCDWATLLNIYNTTDTRIFLSDWKLSSGATGVADLMNAMGVTGAVTIGSVIPMYVWDAGHPICDGIGDWTWVDPGLGVLNNKLTVSDAIPVTGWTASVTAGEAAICVANDGYSVISGFTPAYANDAVGIWENILEFMAGGTGALQQSTWGAIKSSF